MLFELFHTYLCGPFTTSLPTSNYIFTFMNDHNTFEWVLFLKKMETFIHFKQFKRKIE